ncbi:hypothetical protein [Methylocella sp.]|uniref:hypothetical protein n=1 Tax=Methylocella sp. TaxID=1978226 RepID=UPI0037832B24
MSGENGRDAAGAVHAALKQGTAFASAFAPSATIGSTPRSARSCFSTCCAGAATPI